MRRREESGIASRDRIRAFDRARLLAFVEQARLVFAPDIRVRGRRCCFPVRRIILRRLKTRS